MTEQIPYGTIEGIEAVTEHEVSPSDIRITRPRLLVSQDILAWNAAKRVAPLRFRRQNWDIVREDAGATDSEQPA